MGARYLETTQTAQDYKLFELSAQTHRNQACYG